MKDVIILLLKVLSSEPLENYNWSLICIFGPNLKFLKQPLCFLSQQRLRDADDTTRAEGDQGGGLPGALQGLHHGALQ